MINLVNSFFKATCKSADLSARTIGYTAMFGFAINATDLPHHIEKQFFTPDLKSLGDCEITLDDDDYLAVFAERNYPLQSEFSVEYLPLQGAQPKDPVKFDSYFGTILAMAGLCSKSTKETPKRYTI